MLLSPKSTFPPFKHLGIFKAIPFIMRLTHQSIHFVFPLS